MAERPPRRRDDDDKKKTGRPKPRPSGGKPRRPPAASGRGRDDRTGRGDRTPPRARTDGKPVRGRTEGKPPRGRTEGKPPRGRTDGRPPRSDARGRTEARGRPEQRRGGDRRTDRTRQDTRQDVRPAQKRSARSSRDEESATRSGIQYPPRKTVRRGEPAARPEPAPARPVLRTVKGTPVPPKARRSRKATKPAKAGKTAKSSSRAVPRRKRRSTEAADELSRIAGRNAKSAQDQLARAAEAFAAGRERDAARMLRPLRDTYPDAAAVRELLGLVQYRLGNYPAATKELLAFADLTGSVEQHPVLMDCFRAQRNYDRVETLWEELAQSSPSGGLVTEGRIVLAGALADEGRLDDAISTLARRADDVKRVQPHHLRLWYALGDLYERAGEIPRAREMFERVRKQDSSFADVAERLAALR